MRKGEGLGGSRNPNYRHGARTGGAENPAYVSWYGMVQRCTNPNRRYYHRYGGRGIKLHPPWRDFAAFYADMGARPEGTTLDRVDNNGDYEPSNCRWATGAEQRRNSTRARLVTVDGDERALCEWAELYGIAASVVARRLKRGWDVKEALTTPLKLPTDPRRKNRGFARNKDNSVKT